MNKNITIDKFGRFYYNNEFQGFLIDKEDMEWYIFRCIDITYFSDELDNKYYIACVAIQEDLKENY